MTLFLLFAAVLFGVTPAEASIPRGGAADGGPASLQLHELAPSTSANASSRFAEGASLLDVEGAPGCFGLFGLEMSRCERTYARNNPLRYVDPDGKQWADAIQVQKDREYAQASGGAAGLAAYDSGARQGAMIGLVATAAAATYGLAAEYGPAILAFGQQLMSGGVGHRDEITAATRWTDIAAKASDLLTPAQLSRVRGIVEVSHNWTVRKTLSGIPDSGHEQKIREGLNGLTKNVNALNASLRNPNLTSEARAMMEQAVKRAEKLITDAEKLLK